MTDADKTCLGGSSKQRTDEAIVATHIQQQRTHPNHSRKAGHGVLVPPPNFVHDKPEVGVVVVLGLDLKSQLFTIWGQLPAQQARRRDGWTTLDARATVLVGSGNSKQPTGPVHRVRPVS